MVLDRLFGKKCLRCGATRTKSEFDGVPTCDPCQAAIKAQREQKRFCPLDSAAMAKRVVHNVIVDQCPQCGSVWLDRDELDLITKTIKSGASGDFASGLLLGMAIG